MERRARGAETTAERGPERTCVGCRRRAPATELWRVVLDDGGVPVIDRHGPGRGAWLCANSPACFTAAVRRSAFDRAFRRPVGPTALALLANAFEASSANVRESRVARRPPGDAARRKADR